MVFDWESLVLRLRYGRDAGTNPGISHPSNLFFEGFKERDNEDNNDKDEGKGG